MNPSISINNLSLAYRSRPSATAAAEEQAKNQSEEGAAKFEQLSRTLAVDDVSLDIRAGERIGIIGRNGAGKSSLLSMICGVTSPTSGHLNIDGEVHAILTLGTAMREELTGRENIYLDGELKGETAAEVDCYIDDIIDYAELGEFIDSPVRIYSSGMKARLAFSMIINVHPEILLIDETLAVGDIRFSSKALKTMREICERGRIVILVTHGLGAVTEFCNRCVWMEAGRIVQDGPPREVVEAYQKSVHAVDRAQALERLRQTARDSEIRSGGDIKGLRLSQKGQALGGVLETGVPAQLRFSIAATEVPRNGMICVTIRRLDGILIDTFNTAFNDEISLKVGRSPVEFTLNLKPFILAGGVFFVDVEFRDGQRVIARNTTEVEVLDSSAKIGGKPALVHPINIRQRPAHG